MKTGGRWIKRNRELPICLIKKSIEYFPLFLGLVSKLGNSPEQKIIC